MGKRKREHVVTAKEFAEKGKKPWASVSGSCFDNLVVRNSAYGRVYSPMVMCINSVAGGAVRRLLPLLKCIYACTVLRQVELLGRWLRLILSFFLSSRVPGNSRSRFLAFASDALC